jgi:hypothetical protein
MKIIPLSFMVVLTLVTVLVSLQVHFQYLDAQEVGDMISPMPRNVTLPNTDKILVSIVPGATLLTDTAYNPNPIMVNVGQTVLWINDDFSFHTVTSGGVGDADASRIFDSGLAVPTALSSTG